VLDLAAIRRRIGIAATPPGDREVLTWLDSDHALKPEARVRQIGFARVAWPLGSPTCSRRC